MANVGDKAPLFKLYNTNKEEIKLEDYLEKNVLLIFFPLAFTGTCTEELCYLRDNYSKYDELNAQVFGISVDSIFSLERYKEDQNINFPLLSDFNKDVIKSYGAMYEEFVFDMKGVSKRAAFVIDNNGVIKYAEILENALDLPQFNAILECLNNLN